MHTMERTFGAVVRSRRELQSLTQAQLAARAGLSRPAVANIEAGSQRIGLDQVVALAAALGCTGSQLLAEVEANVQTSSGTVDLLSSPENRLELDRVLAKVRHEPGRD
ncbi:hypothetical protein IP84_17340 [beta proteobacterium AAP99]|jgi:transcriptional regulator with XRE-family HTH domain|nr:hypothetical protein IP84_17340 [beta proteobacterium AAP99]